MRHSIVKQIPFLLLIFLSLTSCGARYVNVAKLPFGAKDLASNFAETPDPRKENLETGEKLYVSWRVPFAVRPQDCKIRLKVLYKDLSEEEIIKPITYRIGTFSTPLIGDKFEKRKGFYSYKATLETIDGAILDTWKQLMWVELEK